ncbi:MAG: hypothetical protein QM820_07060 [Minicystis sp.]
MRLSLILLGLSLLAACSSPDAPPADGGPDDAGPADAAPHDAAPADAAPDAPADAAPDAPACTLVSPYSSQDADCNACAEAHCCAAINGCLTDPDCNDGYVNCALACAFDPDAGQDPCLADCASQYPTGKEEYDEAIGCADQACAVECQ